MSAEPGAPGLPAGVSHLLVADDALNPGWIGGSHVAVCGAVVAGPGGGIDDPGYCPRCVAAALRWSVAR